MEVLTETRVPGHECRRGKVRDVYPLRGGRIVIIATDRISAFDVVLPNGIPDKGRVLTGITRFWLENLQLKAPEVLPNHLISTKLKDFPEEFQRPELEGRAMLCREADPLLVECVVRGYITGSGWRDYKATGKVCGYRLPADLKECARLSNPLFTPATKAQSGHDENILFEDVCKLVGRNTATELRRRSIRLYRAAHELAREHGIILADTKFEYGRVGNQIFLIDEVLTPDSSRFWPAEQYQPGHSQPSFDKQFVRDWLQGLCDAGKWDKTPPAPRLPAAIVEETHQKYLEIYRQLTGKGPAA